MSLKEESLASGFQQWNSKEVNMHQVWQKTNGWLIKRRNERHVDEQN